MDSICRASAAVASIASPAYAVQYLSIVKRKGRRSVGNTLHRVQAGRVWKAEPVDAYRIFIFDRVVANTSISTMRGLSPGGAVQKVEILQYRESYGVR